MLLTTKQMSVWRKLKSEQIKICCNGIKLERVSEWKPLHIIIHENLMLSRHILKILKNFYSHLSILKNPQKIQFTVHVQTVNRIANLFKNRLPITLSFYRFSSV